MPHDLSLHYAGPQHIISEWQTFEIAVGSKRTLNKERTESEDIRKEKRWCGGYGMDIFIPGVHDLVQKYVRSGLSVTQNISCYCSASSDEGGCGTHNSTRTPTGS